MSHAMRSVIPVVKEMKPVPFALLKRTAQEKFDRLARQRGFKAGRARYVGRTDKHPSHDMSQALLMPPDLYYYIFEADAT